MKDNRKNSIIDMMKPTVVVRHVIITMSKGELVDEDRERKETGERIVQGNGEKENVRRRPKMLLEKNNGDQGV